MDAWTLIDAWHQHFEGNRLLRGTAHDVLMADPVLGDYFRAVGVVPASRASVTAALSSGQDVAVWSGGERDAMRNWRQRDTATLAGRQGFVRQAIRSGVPIVPVATVGGHDTAFVLSEGQWLANAIDKFTGLKKRLRGANMPIVAGLPFPLAVEVLPAQIPLPAKTRTEILDPIEVDDDPERVDDAAYVQKIYDQVESEIQAGMNRRSPTPPAHLRLEPNLHTMDMVPSRTVLRQERQPIWCDPEANAPVLAALTARQPVGLGGSAELYLTTDESLGGKRLSA